MFSVPRTPWAPYFAWWLESKSLAGRLAALWHFPLLRRFAGSGSHRLTALLDGRHALLGSDAQGLQMKAADFTMALSRLASR